MIKNIIYIAFSFIFLFFSSISYCQSDLNELFLKYVNKTPNISTELLHFQDLIKRADRFKASCGRSNSKDLKNVIIQEKFKRVLFTSMQYFLMVNSMKWIAYNSVALGIDRERFKKQITTLRTKYCSKNISFISHQFIVKDSLDLFDKIKKINFDKGYDFDFSKIVNSKLINLSSVMSRFQLYNKISKEIFKRSCSWNSDVFNPALLSMFLARPIIIKIFQDSLMDREFVRISRHKIKYTEGQNGIYLQCKNLMCRNVEKSKYLRSWEFSSFSELIQYSDALFCKINKKSKSSASDDLITSYIVSKFTNIPDFLLLSNKENEIDQIFLSKMESKIDYWSHKIIKKQDDQLLIEESLTYSLIDQSLFFDDELGNFAINIDVNAGELDKINQINGKFTIVKKMTINKKIIKMFRKKASLRNIENFAKDEKLRLRRLSLIIINEFKGIHQNLILPPPLKSLAGIIADDLYKQIVSYKGALILDDSKENVVIPVYFNYGYFALRYLGKLRQRNDILKQK